MALPCIALFSKFRTLCKSMYDLSCIAKWQWQPRQSCHNEHLITDCFIQIITQQENNRLSAIMLHLYVCMYRSIHASEVQIDMITLQQWSTLAHWGRVTNIYVSDLVHHCSDNGLSPIRRQAIVWTNDGVLLIRTWGTSFSEIFNISFTKMHLKT